MAKLPVVLVADDEPSVRFAFEKLLEKKKYPFLLASNGQEVLDYFFKYKDSLKLLILDVKMPQKSGLEVLEIIKKENPNLKVIIITAFGGMGTTIDAMKRGAYDFLTKPLDLKKMEELIDLTLKSSTVKAAELSDKITSQQLEELSHYDVPLIGKSPKMQEIYKIIGRIAPLDLAVLITGETGVGKELIARVIHLNSKRSQGPYIPINCTSIPPTLIESELFGHVKGAFTGAVNQKIGKFEAADEGTLFLDEIGDMDINLQSKLLRVLQSQEFYKVGGNKPLRVDVRIISATNKDLEQSVLTGEFRADLYHRLRVIEIKVPPLRERKEDIPLLIEFFLKNSPLNPEKKDIKVSEETLKILLSYPWPGNVRELKNVVESALALSSNEVINPEDLPESVRNFKNSTFFFMGNKGKKDNWEDSLRGKIRELLSLRKEERNLYNYFVEKIDNILLKETVAYFQNNQKRAAEYLGINRNTLRKKLLKNQENGERRDGK